MTMEATLKMGKLARIALKSDEVAAYNLALENVLSWVEQLKEIDLKDVEVGHLPGPQTLALREDVIHMTTTVEALMANAPDSKFNMFSVPKVVE